MDFELLKRVLAAFESRGVQYVIFGAVALNLHGLARATEDLDIFVAPDEANIDRLKAALRDVFDDPSIEEIAAHDLLGEYPAVQYIPPEGGFQFKRKCLSVAQKRNSKTKPSFEWKTKHRPGIVK
jgi:hypothetical protein